MQRLLTACLQDLTKDYRATMYHEALAMYLADLTSGHYIIEGKEIQCVDQFQVITLSETPKVYVLVTLSD